MSFERYAALVPKDKLGLVIDSGHGGVDRHLCAVADELPDEWDTQLAPVFGLRRRDVSDILKKHRDEPARQRVAALQLWKRKQGLNATYGNLLKACLEVDYGGCAVKIVELLNAGGSQTASTSVEATDAVPASASAAHVQPNVPALPPPQMVLKDPNFFQSASDQKVEIDGWGSKKLKFERYPHEPKDASTSIKFSFGAINMQPGEKRSIAGAYDMKCWPHGVAVVINNEVFKKQRDRKGTQVDEKNLVQVLRRLGYVVEVYRDCNAQKIVDILEENRQRDHYSYDSFICCILSHGKLGHIYGSDSMAIPLDEVTAMLNGDNCKSLAKKPKMFFLQACRGLMKDTGVEADDDEMEPEPRVLSSSGVRVATDSDSKIPAAEDFYFGYATANGHVAWRDLDYGSWYISELCRSLASYSKFASLNDMMTITNKRVGTTYTHADYKQSTESTTRLSSDVFFF